eukprot:jgi/Tetstr1/433530/TSEL_022798.t1
MPLLDLGLPHRGNHPRYAAHLNEDLFGGLSTSGVLYEPVSRREFAHPLADIASVTELRPDASANDLSGRLILKRACGCCADADAWDFAGPSGQPLRGDVLSKAAPDAYVVEASAFSALSLGQAIVANITGGVSITATSLSAGADAEADVVIAATIVDVA